jgi:pimeloyl-ACP methyl ester carboxylesterase
LQQNPRQIDKASAANWDIGAVPFKVQWMLSRRQFGTAISLGLACDPELRHASAQTGAPNGTAAASSPLFPGEEMIEASGYPALVKFTKGREDQPLVVFVPGTSFLARIAYGFPGGRSEDFLEHWVVSAGYSFLGVSYPLDNPVFRRVYPGFGITDWGRQIAVAAQRSIAANGLSRQIIVVGWSMGGKPVETVAQAARETGLEVELFVALDALPPGPNLFPGNPEQLRLAANGMVEQAGALMPWFLQMVDAQNRINGHTIVPTNQFREWFTGNPPLNIQGENARFSDGRMTTDIAAAAIDSGATNYGSLPSMALIVSNSPADYPNVLLCQTNWGLLVGQQLYCRHVFPVRDRMAALPHAQWAALQAAFAGAMQRLTIQIPGTHFLFLGEQGARSTADAITQLRLRSGQLNREIGDQLERLL